MPLFCPERLRTRALRTFRHKVRYALSLCALTDRLWFNAQDREHRTMHLFSLKDRVALVTGGNGGIGLGMAEGFARAGAWVVLSGRDKTKAGSALASLRAHGGETHFIAADVTDETACRALVAGTIEKFGRLDILVNNAG